MGLYKIVDIQHKDGKTRDDGKYPQRIGSIVEMKYLQTGIPVYLEYISGNDGKHKEGYLKTSTVEDVRFNDDSGIYIVKTLNSVYFLRQEI